MRQFLVSVREMWPIGPRSLSVLAASVAAFVFSSMASATAPTDLAPLGPSCLASAPDTNGAHICWVVPLRPGWQASTGEWIIVRLGNAAPVDPADPDAARTLCEQYQASIVATITLDDQSLPVDTIPCELRQGSPDVWFVDWRALSHPLTPGDHTFSVTWYFTKTVPGVADAGDRWVFPTRTLTVIPQG